MAGICTLLVLCWFVLKDLLSPEIQCSYDRLRQECEEFSFMAYLLFLKELVRQQTFVHQFRLVKT